MTYSILIFAYRKSGTTPEEFRAGYEAHVPVVKEMTGEHFPLSHTRRYIQRAAGQAEGTTERNADYPATVLFGSQADFDYDAVAELTFTDAAAFQTFFGIVQKPENWERIQADEAKFLDTFKMTVVGETIVTTH